MNVTESYTASEIAQADKSAGHSDHPGQEVASRTKGHERSSAASAALAALTGGANAAAVVNALNLEIINFVSGKADIPKDNQDLLKKAAVVLKGAPAGTKIEVGGHTDNKGAAAGNQKLSQTRAEAVTKFLVAQGVKADALVAKYGGIAERIAMYNAASASDERFERYGQVAQRIAAATAGG